MIINNQKNRSIDTFKVIVYYIMVPIACILLVGLLYKNMDESSLALIQTNIIGSEIPQLKNNECMNDAGIPNGNNLLLVSLKERLLDVSSIISMEIPMFEKNNTSTTLDEKPINEDDFEQKIAISPFNVTNDSIIKLNPEEVKGTEGLEASKCFDPSLVKPLNEGNPEVLIYNSHTMEAYGKSDSDVYSQSVIGVGTSIQEELKKYGISSIQDIRINRTYNKSYQRSREAVQSYLSKYNTFKIIVDIHRDSVAQKDYVTTTINGESLAKIAFVTANNNPHHGDNQALINELNEISRKLFPGLSRGVICYNRGICNAFNQDLSKNSLLIEVGSQANTPAEANTTARYIARIIAEKINRK